MRGNSRGDPRPRFDALAERCAVGRIVEGSHGADAQVIQALLGKRQADKSAAIFSHEVDGFRSNFFRRQGEITFIFAVFVVHDYDHTSGADLCNRLFNRRKWRLRVHKENCSRMRGYVGLVLIHLINKHSPFYRVRSWGGGVLLEVVPPATTHLNSTTYGPKKRSYFRQSLVHFFSSSSERTR